MNGIKQLAVSYVDAWLIDNRDDINAEPIQSTDDLLPALNASMLKQLGTVKAFDAWGGNNGYDAQTLRIQCHNLKVRISDPFKPPESM